MADNFASHAPGLDSPISNAVAVTPHDTNDLATTARVIYVGVSGDVKVDMAGSGTAIVFTALPVGWHPIRVTRVYSTDTTATDIVAGW